MKLIMIENEGEVDILAFTLMGASSKRNSTDKIGFFGSGNKYAIANLLRRGIDFSIYSGINQIKVYTKQVTHREQTFDNIVFETDGVPFTTSLTTAMGPKWEPWYIIRELYCNAVDEGGVRMEILDDKDGQISYCGTPGKTRIFIELVDELYDVVNHWNGYFTNERRDLIEHMGPKEITMFENTPEVKLYHKYDEKFRIYRKGVLVYVGDEKSIFDYDLFTAEINEERILSNVYQAKRSIGKAVGGAASDKVIKKLVQGMDKNNRNNFASAETEMYVHYQIPHNKENWAKAVDGLIVVNGTRKESYADELKKPNTVLLDGNISYQLGQSDLGKVLGVPAKGLSHSFKECIVTEEHQGVLNKAFEFLVMADFDFGGIKIQPVNFDDYAIAGMADLEGNKIFIGQACFDKGLKFMVNCLMEEHSHIASRFGDETRAFQNYLLDKWLCEIEKRMEITL